MLVCFVSVMECLLIVLVPFVGQWGHNEGGGGGEDDTVISSTQKFLERESQFSTVTFQALEITFEC